MRAMRLLPLCVLCAVLFASVAATAQEASSSVRIVNPIDEKHLVTLKGTMHPLATAANDRGAAPDGMQLQRIHMVLQRSPAQESTLRQLINDLHAPGSPSFHKWLTPDQFGKQFGPSDQDIATVESWLAQHGFTGAKVLPGRQTIEFTGSVGQFRGAFHAAIHKYQVNGENRYANSSDPQIPAALAPVVKGFVSLNNFRLKSLARQLGKAQYDPKTDQAKANWTWGTPSTGEDFVVAPGDFAVEYDLNPLYSAGLTGAGQSIAIIDYSNINVDLVNQFRTLFGLPKNPPQVIVDGNDPGVDGINDPEGPAFGTAVESYLDVEWAGAVAPNATIDLIVAADTQLESGAFLAAEHAVYGNVAPILSSSIYQYGCEQEAGAGNQFIESLWEQAAAQGITVLEAAGDSGSAGCDSDASDQAQNGLGVNNWASTPFNLAIGGTDFYYTDWATGGNSTLPNYWSTSIQATPGVSLKKYLPEQPWNNSQFGLNLASYVEEAGDTTIAGGSGGASNCATGTGTSPSNGGWDVCTAGYPKPLWQKATGVPADGVRDIPDVSLFAADGLNYSFYPICASDADCQAASGGNPIQITGVGGTSASAPAFAGIMALINQKYSSRQGQAAYVLYPMKSQFPAAFHDVTAGTNSMPCETGTPDCIAAPADNTVFGEGQLGTGTTPDYNATAGYNLATGLGTVDATVLVNDWNKVTFATSTTTLTATPTSLAHGSTVSIGGKVTGSGTPTGDVAIMADTTDPMQQGQTNFTLSGGSYSGSLSYLPGGSYNIWAQYEGDTKNGASSSPKVPITITAENSGILFNVLEPSGSGLYTVSSPVSYGQQLTLSAQPAPTGQVTALQNCESGAGSCPSFTYPTGTVTFKDGSTVVNTAVVNAEGDAEFTPPAGFNAGSHSITAEYSGDKSYNASTSSAIQFTVQQSPPSVFISGSTNGSSYSAGQTTTLTIAVEGFGNGGAPAGSVTVSGAPSGTPTTATLSAGVDPELSTTLGVATVTIPSSASAGTYNINAAYVPSGASVANYGAASTTSAYPIQITAASGTATTTTGTLSSSSTSPNALVTVTGTVKAASGAAPTGSVTVYYVALTSYGSIGDIPLGSINITPGSGSTSNFSFTVGSSNLLIGANQLTLSYSGGGADAPSTGVINIANALADFQLVPEATIVPVKAGGSGTVVVNLASTNGFSGVVNLSCAGTGVTCSIPASATLTSGGQASATLTINAGSAVANGTYNVIVTGTDSSTKEYVHTLGIEAVVAGSSTASPTFSMSNSGSISVTAGATTGNTSTVSVTPSGGFTGTVALSCQLTNPPGGIVPPTCTIPASVNITGTAAQTAALTVDTTASTTPGAYIFTVTGISGTITQTTVVDLTVNAATTPAFSMSNSAAIAVIAGATTGNTSTVSVTPSGGFTGTVNLTCAVTTAPTGASSPVTCTVPASVDVNSASAVTATLTAGSTDTTTAGAYVITVTGVSGSITQTTTANVTVTAPAAASFALTGNPTSLSFNPGAANGNSTTISVTPSGGFTGSVALTCAFATNASTDPATCSFSPASADVTGTSAVTSSLTISTTASTSSKNEVKKLFWPSAGGATVAFLLFFGLPKRRRNWLAMLGLLAVFAGLAGMGCGVSGGSGGGGGGGGNTGTTPGTYSVTVTGTSGSLTQTTTVSVTVE